MHDMLRRSVNQEHRVLPEPSGYWPLQPEEHVLTMTHFTRVQCCSTGCGVVGCVFMGCGVVGCVFMGCGVMVCGVVWFDGVWWDVV